MTTPRQYDDLMESGGKDAADLTERQREFLTLLVADCADKEIARRMRVGIAAVRDYHMRLRRRAGAIGRVGLALWAIRHGINPPE